MNWWAISTSIPLLLDFSYPFVRYDGAPPLGSRHLTRLNYHDDEPVRRTVLRIEVVTHGGVRR